ncbi:MAG: D-alanyl-D-alanine carboxypeptidase/D-alanyl-D-alanine-endopeptidase [Microlunatus sp.]
MGLKRLAIGIASFLALSIMALGLITGTFGRLVGGNSTAASRSVGASPSTSPTRAGSTDSSGVAADPSTSGGADDPVGEAIELPRDVLPAAKPGDQPDAASVTTRIEAVSRKGVGGVYSGSVVDVGSGTKLFSHRAGVGEIPASVTKILTTSAVLAELGPDHRFTTSVVRSGKQIILVGGGDPYLTSKTTSKTYPARASVTDLAKLTATALKKAKVTTVKLGYDDSLFSGPSWNPSWPTSYGDQTTRTSALWVDEGRLAGYSPGPRTSDPAGHATRTFAAALKKKGIKVTVGGELKVSKKYAKVAAVQSMPLERIVERILMVSDNDGAEVLFRHVAIAAGRDGSIKEARKAMKATLTKLGAWQDGTALHDGSGLSRDNRISGSTLTRLLRLAAQDSHPELRGVITGLPVAGVEGSLEQRFDGENSAAARGMVRGKTGTLRQVYSLAGYVRTTDGNLVVYAFITNGATSEYATKNWLDDVSAAVATCGCSS